MWALLVLVVVAAGGWSLPRYPGASGDAAIVANAAPEPRLLGTAGIVEPDIALGPDHVVREIETITGTIDGMSLVGRRVDLHVEVQRRATDVAFWIGSADNRVLIVLKRDPRPSDRHGVARGHAIVPVRDGQRATISGMIRRMPKPGQVAAWGLSAADEAELADRKIYIHADAVSSDGHGTH
jgi:hypothetical protein